MVLTRFVGELPRELSSLVELATDDNRPTLILESQPASIAFKNVAFDDLLAESPVPVTSSELDQWLSAELSSPSPAQASRTKNFAGRTWIKKKLGTSHAIIYCNHEYLRGSTGCKNDDTQGLQSMVQDWIRYPDIVPTAGWTRFLQNYNWENTAIGPMETWPALLRNLAIAFMHCPQPRIIYWGNDLAQIYNEAASKLFGDGHPVSMGNGMADFWGHDIWSQTSGTIRDSHDDGHSTQNLERLVVIDRGGFLEEVYFDWFLLPFTGSDGRWICSVNCFNEVTSSVVSRDRNEVSTKVLASAAKATTLPELWSQFLGVIDEDADDVVYALLYTVDGEQPVSSTSYYRLYGSAGLTDNAAFTTVTKEMFKVFQRSEAEEEVVVVKGETWLPEFGIEIAEYGAVNTAFVLPVSDLEGITLAHVVLGMNPRRRTDKQTQQFVYSLSEVILKAVIILQSPANQRRMLQADDALSYRLQLERLSRQLSVATLKAEKNQQTFGRMAERAPIGIFLYEADGTPLFTNDKFLELLGETREGFYEKSKTGFAWRDCIAPEDWEFTLGAWRAATEADSFISIEFRVKETAAAQHSPTRSRWLEALVCPQRDANGNLESVQGYLLDISVRKLTESLAIDRINDAMESKRASENFIDMVCHEIRNPLSSILQLAELILATLPNNTLAADVRDTLVDAAQTLTICAMHQKTIIDEVLTFSKLDSNLLVLAPERASPLDIIEKAEKMFDAELTHADVQLEVKEIPDSCAMDEIICDPGRLLQIIINFLTNAIKFTKSSTQRRITISYGTLLEPPKQEDYGVTFIKPRKKDHQDDTPGTPFFPSTPLDHETRDLYLYFSVDDTGCGLTAEESQLLFQRFAQASPRTYKNYGGSGLGLFICRELVELQHGQIGVHSEAGQGSRFAFYIKAKRMGRPVRSPSIASVESAVSIKDIAQGVTAAFEAVKVVEIADTVIRPRMSVKDMHVLVVEDNEINRKVMAQQLRRLGCQVHVAEHGLEALTFLSTTTFLSSTEGGTPLSLILLDIEMPVMDGLTCIKRIRQLEDSNQFSGHIPTIAITANARLEQVANAIECGMDEVVTKPFKIRDLVPRMEALVEKWSDVG